MASSADSAYIPAPRKLRAFVQGTLGCRCPGEIFRHIEGPTTVSISDVISAHRLIIGKRLLIYLLDANNRRQIEAMLPPITARGIAEREANGWNRLRIVVATSKPEALVEPAIRLFRGLPDRDDRVHLHVVDRRAVTALYEGACA